MNGQTLPLIIGFDGWSQGRSHYQRLVQPLSALGYRLMLLHVGSWGHDRDQPPEQLIDGLLIRDIKYYKGRNFLQIFHIERPSAVIFTATRSFPHQTFNVYAKALNIPTIHMFHGLVTVQAVEAGQATYKPSVTAQLRMLFGRAGKNAFRILPSYIAALRRSSAPLSDYVDIAAELANKVAPGALKPAPAACQTTAGLVYAQSDVEIMTRIYHVPRGQVSVVGNPDLIKFGISSDDFGCLVGRNAWKRKELVYIDTALVDHGYVKSADAYIHHLQLTSEFLAKSGFTLLLKPHPATTRSGLAAELALRGIPTIPDDQFVTSLKNSAGAIVEPSSAAIVPALLGLPVFLAQYGVLEKQNYGEVLSSYPRSRFLTSLSLFGALLDGEQSILSREAFDHWKTLYVGPLPAEDMPIRVSEAIIRAIDSNPKLVGTMART
jgi:hypothetical protein